jgi:hypothetical protein
MTTAEVTVTVHTGLALELARSPQMRTILGDVADGLAAELRSEAPVRTGAGRRSITSDVVMAAEGWVGTAGWDPAHFYMGIQNRRTHWAQPTLSRVRYV